MSQLETKPFTPLNLDQLPNNTVFDTLLINVNIATMADTNSFGIINNGSLGIIDGIIAYIGEVNSQYPAKETVNANGQWILPGLIDCHTHLIYGGNRANEFEMRLNGATYEEIAKAGGGIISSVTATRDASPQELFDSASKRLECLIEEGVTTIEIKSGYGLDLETELKMLRVANKLREEFPIRVIPTFLGAHALPPEYQDNSDGYIDLVCDEMIPVIANEKLATSVDVFCENIGFSYEQTEKVFRAAKAHGLKVKLHAEQLSDQSGAALVAQYNGLSADHLEYLSQASIEQMAKAGTVATLLPGAFYFLRETKLPPIQALRDAGVPIAIATDHNPGTSPCLSIILMMNMACTLFKMTPLESLQGVTINAAKALGLDKEIGSIEIGKKAELVLWDIEHPNQLSYQFGTSFKNEALT
ncbi:imidazolonepropionase [Kangiella sp. HZ709]|uniref:imidazolonepropionase n=1 Tax=Kangiella sp. HZ709 TaxID=2666328 RepID=UPI0012B0AAE4|nr:imidazolonepropionase [Kangiella sp. HZ709]MRX26999.1 imidazolonepropionase [Kangiella sp. HZ709]